MPRIDGHGISIDLPSGFEGEIFAHPATMPESEVSGGPGSGTATLSLAADRTEPPVVHVATFALPPERGDFGNGAVDRMGTEDVFIAVCEYDRESAGTPLFAAVGLPRLTVEDFSTSTLHRSFPNHSGCQKFFHVGDRAFCLYVVLGSHNFRGSLVRRANQVIERMTVADL